MAKQTPKAVPAAPERKWTLGSARELVLFLTALVALLTPLVGFATGSITLSGLSFFGSPGFWCVYIFLLVILMTAVADCDEGERLRKAWLA